MEHTKKWLDKNRITYTVSADGFIYVDGDITIPETQDFVFEGLAEVSGSVYVREGATFTAPELTDADQIIFDGGMYGQKLRNFDGMGAIVLSEKQKDGVTIAYCRKSKMVKGKFTGEKFYVASMGDKHAHGTTIALATQELVFKTGNRDLSQLKDIKLDTVKTPDEWAFVYRMVTGACQYGTQQFMKSQKLKKKYTLSEIIKLTSGAYGGSQFATFMKGAA